MNDKKGFIASSMIYSFFLVFIAILAALVSSYIANKTIHLRFNEEAIEKLNGNTHTLVVYSKEATIQDGITLYNLVENGNFENDSMWTATNASNFSFPVTKDGKTCLESYGHVNQYVYQPTNINYSHKYYSSIEIWDSYGIASSNISNSSFLQSEGQGSWKKYSSSFGPLSESLKNYIRVGDVQKETSGSTFFTNVMLIDLTNHFGINNEPNQEWLDKNLIWFAGSINMRAVENMKKGNAIQLVLRMEDVYDEVPSITCKNSDAATVEIDDVKIERGEDITLEDGIRLKSSVITIPSLEEDLVCSVSYTKSE